jgi:hypothetical protein
MLKNIISILLLIIIILISLSCYYFTIAYANSGSFRGTLINAEVIIKTTCSNNKKGGGCSQTYYVGETFQKDNSTNTCLVTRLQPFYFQGAANNVVENKELYTTRTIWTTWYSSGTCYDKTIRSYYNSIAEVLSGFAIVLLIVIGVICLSLLGPPTT